MHGIFAYACSFIQPRPHPLIVAMVRVKGECEAPGVTDGPAGQTI